MNIFRGLGDFSHVLAILIILHKLLKTKSCAGIIIVLIYLLLGI